MVTKFAGYKNVDPLNEDKKKEKNKTNNIFCILNWGMAVNCSRNMNFVSETSEEKCFNAG